MSVGSGKSFPLGASIQPGGVNFSVFSEHATAVRLLLFDRADDARPTRTIELDPRRQRTYHYWHAFVPGLQAGRSTPGGSRGRAGRTSACGSIRTSCCWIRTAVQSRCRRRTIAARPRGRATMPR
jgi:hypothetical protein